MLLSCGVLIFAMAAGLVSGAKSLSFSQLLDGMLGRADDEVVLILGGLRWPRVLLGGLVGAALALAGAIIQVATRNPLGDPGLLGVNAGASLAVVAGTGLFGLSGMDAILWLAAAGAGAAALAVPLIAGAIRGRVTPIQLTLSGVAVGALCFGLTQAVALADPERFDMVRNWRVGSLAGRADLILSSVTPALIAGFALTALLAPRLNLLALGTDRATSLGLSVARTQAGYLLAVTLLAGSATAAAGPIAFVGLAAPHAARYLVGADERAVLLNAGLLGAALTIAADALGRAAAAPAEVPVGVATALLGAPVLILLVRMRRLREAR